MDLLRRQFQYNRGERILSKVIGPEFKSYWPNRIKEVININTSIFTSEISIRHATSIGTSFAKIFRQLPMTTTEIYRENMIEWRSRRGGNKKK